MSVTREHTVWCDTPGCKNFVQVAERTESGARKAARLDGWQSTTRGRKDYCPRCRRAQRTGGGKAVNERVVVKREGTSRAHLAIRNAQYPNVVPNITLCSKNIGRRRVLVDQRWDDLLASGSQYSGDRMCPDCRDIDLGRVKS